MSSLLLILSSVYLVTGAVLTVLFCLFMRSDKRRVSAALGARDKAMGAWTPSEEEPGTTVNKAPRTSRLRPGHRPAP